MTRHAGNALDFEHTFSRDAAPLTDCLRADPAQRPRECNAAADNGLGFGQGREFGDVAFVLHES